ncbi:Desmocollin-2 [Ophiophagus hannah]|uniref:Desmocollin-2 n=2 Tax=Elapinae TaxID=42168 RepID=V8PI32_OPHHA|nr:Desmocollin-2 [Ophiophagus hannah]
MGGEEFGLYSTAAVHIEIGDVNDNLPQIAQSMYVVEVYENIEHVEILCIPVDDKDEPRTSSWMGVFAITKGNEDNSFALTVDQQQNIGCLSTLKELDFEKSHERRLEIVINNEAPYVSPPNSRALPTSMVSVVVKIKDQDEGPVFESCEYILYINERLLVGTVVGNYQAMDPETGNKPLSYRIIKDQCGWITIDEKGNLKTTDILERDSKNIEYSQCNVTVSAIDQSGKTGNGIIVIKLAIENNYPVNTSKHYVMCKDKKPICINASDIDLPMSTIPFHFEIEKPMDLKWKLTPNDGMFLVFNIYKIHYIQVERTPAAAPVLGAWSIPAMVMGSLAMLSGFGAPFGLWLYRKHHTPQEESDLTFENLTRSNTEAPGEGNTRPNTEAPEILLLFFIFQNLNIIPMSTMNEFINMNTDIVKTEKKDLETGKRGWHSTSELIKGGKVNHVALSLQNCAPSLRNSFRDFCTEWQTFTNPRLSEVLSLSCEACKKVTLNVPPKLNPDTLIGQVNLKRCLRTPHLISTSDPDFIVLENGSIFTTNAVSLPSGKKTFTILLKNLQNSQQKQIHVNLLSHSPKTHKTGEIVLRRSKRRWAPVPTTIMENSLGPFPMQIQQIICYAKTLDGYTPEIPLVHLIRIEDDNDNPPIFNPDTVTFSILENSRSGTFIGQMTATDRDEPDTLHTKLKYRIVGQTPASFRGGSLFTVQADTGDISLQTPSLDREKIDRYTVLLEARDMGGQSFGLCNTGTVVIEVGDANDHAPMCEHGVYEVFILENTVNAEVTKIGVIDKDIRGTPAWHATFNIVKGNEDGSFKIETNRDSNTGTLCIKKGLDYEKTKERRLEIVVNNEVPYVLAPNSGPISTSTCVVVVKVRDVDEGPEFHPKIYILDIKECLKAGSVVGHYSASDPETRNNEDIRYKIIKDPCNWITVNNGGEISTTKMLDRDAPDLQSYQCNVTVAAVDRSGKTGTGTIIVNLLDENDNYPVIVPKEYIICKDRKPICLTAVDADIDPHTVPFTFFIFEKETQNWRLTENDDRSVYLEPSNALRYGQYIIPIRVSDSGGNSGISEIKVTLCDCTVPQDCLYPPKWIEPHKSSDVTLGIWAILAMILGSLLLLLILITLCGCFGGAPMAGTKHVCDDLANQNLIISNTEAPGEEDPNILPVKTGNIVTSDQGVVSGVKTGGQESFEMVKGGHQTMESIRGGAQHTLESHKGAGHHTIESGRGYGQSMMDTYRYNYSEWQNYTFPRLTEKVYLCGQDEEHKHSDDYILSYNYEGRGSPAGSVGCCTDQQEEEALDFLDQLEPKFRTLAETCVKR